ncbi:MAG: M28 family peptidase, partial [Elusimicrobiota bacterium]
MKHRVPVAVLASLLLASSSFAQTMGVVVPRLPGGAPALIISGAPVLAGGFSMSTLEPLALTPTLALAAIAAAPVNISQATALDSGRTLSGALFTASEQGRDPAPVLSAAFDGNMKRATGATPDAVYNPLDSFILEARSRFAALRREEAERGSRPEGAVPSDEEMYGRMDRLPSTNSERMKFIVDLFKLGGAKDGDIVLQDADRGRNNVIVTKKGKTDRVIVIGGHYDKVSEGLGKIDNGTGSTMVANLYQALQDVDTDATIVFVAFAREEEGLYGSRAYVRSLDKAKLGKIDAMINLDTLAVDGTFSWKNNSTRAVLDRLAQVSRESGHALKEDYLNGGDADSSTFRDAGIPAVTVYG